jgi:RNA polymerase sigma-70 factor (ECF subfamily)
MGDSVMIYNKAAEEKKWRLWKAAEEKKLRRLGVSEEVIKRLREADWDDFKSERRYLKHYDDRDTSLDWLTAGEVPLSVRTAQDLLNDIENEELLRVLMTVDKLTLQLVVWKMDGCSGVEISDRSGLSVATVKKRMERFKKKIIKFLK